MAYGSLVGSSELVSSRLRSGGSAASDKCSSTQEEQFLDPHRMGGMDEVGLDHEVVMLEIRPVTLLAWMPPTLAAATKT